MDFRISVKRICKEKGLLQKDLADMLGITYISLNQTLRGKYPQLQTLERIADALGVPITELFQKSNDDVFQCPKCGTTLQVVSPNFVVKNDAV